MAVTIAACRTLTAARPLALASRVSWFRFRAMPLSWAMKSSCSRVIRALTVPRSISWRRTSAGGCLASRQRAEKRSFRSGLSRVLTTYLQMRPMPTFGRPPCFVFGLLCGRSDSRLRPCARGKNGFGRLARYGGKDRSDRQLPCVLPRRCRRRCGSPDAGRETGWLWAG